MTPVLLVKTIFTELFFPDAPRLVVRSVLYLWLFSAIGLAGAYYVLTLGSGFVLSSPFEILLVIAFVLLSGLSGSVLILLRFSLPSRLTSKVFFRLLLFHAAVVAFLIYNAVKYL